jgi:hypothetical protein
MTKEDLVKKKEEISKLIQKLCAEKLNQEYADLCEKLLLKLSRKRVVPFATGKAEIWAVAIVHAIGYANFLYDPASEPHLKAEKLNAFYGTSGNSVSAKSKLIREMFKIRRFGSEFSTQRMRERNPFANFVMVDGLPTPISLLSPELQDLVRETRSRGNDIVFNHRTEE